MPTNDMAVKEIATETTTAAEVAVKQTVAKAVPANQIWTWGDVKETDITPSWVGGDGIFTEGTSADGAAVLRRVFTKESRPYASPFESIATMMQIAGNAGISPQVISVGEDEIIMRKLPGTWRNAKLDELRDPYVLWAVLEQHRRVHELAIPQGREVMERDLIEDVFGMRDLYRHTGKRMPRDVDRLLKRLDPFIRRVDEFHEPAVPCHGDGAASNVLLDPQIRPGDVAQPLLCGWTVSGVMDPLEEAGSVLSEVGPFCGVPSMLINGLGLPSSALPVAQVFGILGDLYWALIGLWRSATTDTPQIDFAKYGLWRLVKASNQLLLPTGPAAWLDSL